MLRVTLLRADVYRLMALAFAHPTEERMAAMEELVEAVQTSDLWAALDGDVRDALEGLRAALREAAQEDLEGEYHRLFATAVAVPACESSYGLQDKGAILLDVTGFYRAFGLNAGRGQEPPDSIGHELEFLAVLALKTAVALERNLDEAHEVTEKAEKDFLIDHLGRWYCLLGDRLASASPQPFYQAAARLLRCWVHCELDRLSLQPEPLPFALPVLEDDAPSCAPDASPEVR